MMKRTMLTALLLGYLLVAYSLAAAWSPAPHWQPGRYYPVDSSVFDAVRYDARRDTLTLLFRSGDAYEYYGVSRKTWLTLMRVRRKGSFFNAHIRRAYAYKRIGYAP